MKAERIWTYELVSTEKFLTDRLSHLQAEVGLCIPVLFKAKTGFWAIARMLFPIIEATAETIGPATHPKKPVWILGELGVAHPHLVWEMYRHTLMHNDDMFPAEYQGKRIEWSVAIGGGHGGTVPGLIHVDLEQLYADFVTFLTGEIAAAKAQPSEVNAKVSFAFNEGFAQATRAEATSLAT